MKYLIFILFSTSVYSGSFMSRNFKADFKQQIKSKISNKIKESNLQMDYAYPGKFKVESLGKDAFMFVSNGTLSWYYRAPYIEGEQGEVTIRPVNSLKFLRVFDALYKGEKTEGYFSVKSKDQTKEFHFTKKIVDEVGAKKIIFTGSKKLETIFDANEIKIIKEDDGIIIFKIIKLESVKSFSKKHFEFEIPKNTKVIKN